MKRIFLSAAAILSIIRMHGQVDTSGFRSRKLNLDEINFVSSFYHQDGDHAAVTGGIGSQKLTDFANVIDVRLTGYDKRLRKKTLTAEVGIDHYTSASSDRIDLKANTSASHADTRFYPSVGYTLEDEQKGKTIGAGLSSSTEFDYQSFGGNISYSKKTKNRNGEFTSKVQLYLDQVSLITPQELRNYRNDEAGSSGRTTITASLAYSQIINRQFQIAFLADVVQQQGFLSLPFYRVYFQDGTVHQERLPEKRFKLPLGFRANYFFGDNVIVRTYFRYYTDDWGLRSQTASIETPVKITPFLSVTPFYRYYKQTAVDYFAPFKQHTSAQEFFTSNYDLSAFTSSFIGAGIRTAPVHGVLNMQHVSMFELRYGHYSKNIGLNADIVSLNIQFK